MSRFPAITVVILAGALCAVRVRSDDAPPDKDDYQYRIFVANADGSGMKPFCRLPEYQIQGSPTWSQDGKLFAFDARRPQLGEQMSDSRIVIVNADGTNPQVLGDGCMPSFSPRTHRIVYSRYTENRGVWVMSLADKTSFLIDKDGWSGQWSPNGKRIVYTNLGQPNLIVCDIVEGTREPLFDPATNPYRSFSWSFKWSPDGRKIVFRGDRPNGQVEIGIVDARGAKHGLESRFVAAVSTNFAFRPDGRRVLFSYKKDADSQIQLYTLDPDTKDEPERLPGQDPARNNLSGAFSPDGKRLALVCSKTVQPKKDENKAP
jgi:Tol biopolymer transport system component